MSRAGQIKAAEDALTWFENAARAEFTHDQIFVMACGLQQIIEQCRADGEEIVKLRNKVKALERKAPGRRGTTVKADASKGATPAEQKFLRKKLRRR